MGVPGLWDIVSPAERKYSLEELALNNTINHNKNLRIAIDISIWKFQAQSTQGGVNAALRTIFYRCCRLYSLGIRAVFVFDGDQRPAYKRNQNIDTSFSNRVEHHLLLAMVKLFGFAAWNASGEAEAECAVLQRLDYVDIVFTADVDVFLFGGQRVARNWPGTDYEPISCVDSEWIEQTTSLDRSDMILMALLSGSDYGSGVNRLGIQVSLELAKFKYHRPVLDALQKWMNTNTYNSNNHTSTNTSSNNNSDNSDSNSNSDSSDNSDSNDNSDGNRNIDISINESNSSDNDMYFTQLYEMIDKLQHELTCNQSGVLRRRHHKIDLKSLLETQQLTNLAKDWMQPKAAVLDPANMEAAKNMYSILNDEYVRPEFVSLASFCQTQFDWSKAVTLNKFAKKLYPGYMLHRNSTWYGAHSSTTSTRIIPSVKLYQQASRRRQRMHPYFTKNYRNKGLFYPDETQQQQPTDLYRIHMMEDIRKTKHGIRLQKLSRCRVEWQHQTLVDFLSMVETELLDGVGTDADSSQVVTSNVDSQMVDDLIGDSLTGVQGSCVKVLDNSNDDDDDDDNCIDLTTLQQSPAAPPVGPPSLSISVKQSTLSQTRLSHMPGKLLQPLSPAPTTKGNDDGSWISQYCDPKKCCRQWIGSKLVETIYPTMMDEFIKTQQAKKKKRTSTTIDSTQKRLDSFFTPIHNDDHDHNTPSSVIADGNDPNTNYIDTNTNYRHTSNTATITTVTTAIRNMRQQRLQSDSSLILPSRKNRIAD